MKKAIAIIQARMSSSRLPGKVMLPLAGRPMVWHVWNRAIRCKEVEEVIVATSTDISDDAIALFCEKQDIGCYRGSLDNVLDRFLGVIDEYPSEYIVRITCDCPLIHPPLIDEQLKAVREFDGDMVWCTDTGDALEGQGVISVRALRYIEEHSDDPDDLEHAGSVFTAKNPGAFRIVEFRPQPKLIVHGLRLTVDEYKDYLLMSRIYEELWSQACGVPLLDALAWLKEHPEIASMNAQIQHKDLNKQAVELRRKWTNIPKVGQWIMGQSDELCQSKNANKDRR
jgi:spore coat polysaccharide biosynthesis protein SpsF